MLKIESIAMAYKAELMVCTTRACGAGLAGLAWVCCGVGVLQL